METTKILIADDASTVRNFISFAINKNFNNVETDTVSNGRDAMAKMEIEKYNLILCDWNMPHISGIEILEWVRNHPKLKSTPFVLITANNERDSILEATKLGADAYILKPLTVDSLIDKISSLINLNLKKSGQ